MNELSNKEKNLLKSIHVSAKVKEEIKKVWRAGEYKYQREYTNFLLFLMPMFILVFLVTKGSPELNTVKYIWAGAAWVIYFAIPTFFILRICFKMLAANDRTVLLGHSAMYLWRRPKVIKTVYSKVVSLLLVLILAKAGLLITGLCLAMTFIIIAICTITIRKKVQSELDEIDQKNGAPEVLPVPEGIVP